MDTEREREGERESGGKETLCEAADFLSIEDHRPSVCEIADDKTSLQRASGWKIIHFSSQLQEMVRRKFMTTVSHLFP